MNRKRIRIFWSTILLVTVICVSGCKKKIDSAEGITTETQENMSETIAETTVGVIVEEDKDGNIWVSANEERNDHETEGIEDALNYESNDSKVSDENASDGITSEKEKTDENKEQFTETVPTTGVKPEAGVDSNATPWG